MTTQHNKPPIIRYKKISDFTYNLPKWTYTKTDKDIYAVYKQEVKNPLPYETFKIVLLELFKTGLTKLFPNNIWKVPYIGNLFYKYVKKTNGRNLVDYRKLEKGKPIVYFQHLDTFPRLSLCTKTKRYRNNKIYKLWASRKSRSIIFKKYID